MVIYTTEVEVPTPTTDGMDTYAPMHYFMGEDGVVNNEPPETPNSATSEITLSDVISSDTSVGSNYEYSTGSEDVIGSSDIEEYNLRRQRSVVLAQRIDEYFTETRRRLFEDMMDSQSDGMNEMENDMEDQQRLNDPFR